MERLGEVGFEDFGEVTGISEVGKASAAGWVGVSHCGAQRDVTDNHNSHLAVL